MSHGNSNIIRKSYLDDDLRTRFLEGFNKEPNYFDRNDPTNDTARAVLEFLSRQQFDCNKRYIEYWYQEQEATQDLWPHVDFNDKLRFRLREGEIISPYTLMSPITICCYLETKDLVGGDLCISERSWLSYDNKPDPIEPVEALYTELAKHNYERYTPYQGDVLYFEGSRYYHWIDKVVSGSRKSMLLNFWDEI